MTFALAFGKKKFTSFVLVFSTRAIIDNFPASHKQLFNLSVMLLVKNLYRFKEKSVRDQYLGTIALTHLTVDCGH